MRARTRALWSAGAVALGVCVLALGAAATPRASEVEAAALAPVVEGRASLSGALSGATAPAIEVGARNLMAASPWTACRPAERPSQVAREAWDVATAAALGERPVEPSQRWRAPGHLRVGGDGAGDEGPS